MKRNMAILLLLTGLSAMAGAATPPVALGCGTIVSMRESTQKPIVSELADMYGFRGQLGASFGGQVTQMLNLVPGVGFLAAVVGEVVVDAAANSVRNKADQARIVKERETLIYKNIQAVEFKFDDGEVINVPLYVVSGMRYKVGARLNVTVSNGYGALEFSVNPLFGGAASIGDAKYKENCRIDDPEVRKTLLASAKDAVDESRIVNVKARRSAVVSEPAVIEVPAAAPMKSAESTDLDVANITK